jgi:hypothetical protein
MLRSQLAESLTGSKSDEPHTQEADRAQMAGSRAVPSLSWDFSRVLVFAPYRPSQPQTSALLVQPMPVQAKLMVNTPGDIYEQEADEVSERVMRMPEPQLQRACSCGGGCPQCQEQPDRQHKRLQTKRVQSSDTGQFAAPPILHKLLRSPGQPLDPATRGFMERRFGYDFSRVRVHADADAAKCAATIKARAFTSGQDIFFRQGEYKPSSQVGQELLAHELTHVVQQKNEQQSEQIQRAPEGGSEEPSIAGTPDDAIEMWKDIIAHRHFQQKGSEGDITFARLKIVDKEGRTVVNILTESDKLLHAEEKAIAIARKQIGEGQKVGGGKIIFVTDQTLCNKPGRCRDQINKLAEELGVEEARSTVFRRPALPQEQEGAVAGPKATAKKVQKNVVEGLELTESSETIYKRGRAIPGGGGGTPAPVVPPAQVAHTQGTALGGGGGTPKPATPSGRDPSKAVTTAKDQPSVSKARNVSEPAKGPPKASTTSTRPVAPEPDLSKLTSTISKLRAKGANILAHIPESAVITTTAVVQTAAILDGIEGMNKAVSSKILGEGWIYTQQISLVSSMSRDAHSIIQAYQAQHKALQQMVENDAVDADAIESGAGSLALSDFCNDADSPVSALLDLSRQLRDNVAAIHRDADLAARSIRFIVDQPDALMALALAEEFEELSGIATLRAGAHFAGVDLPRVTLDDLFMASQDLDQILDVVSPLELQLDELIKLLEQDLGTIDENLNESMWGVLSYSKSYSGNR